MPSDLSFRQLFLRCDAEARRRVRWMYSILRMTFFNWRSLSRADMNGSSCASTTRRTWRGLHQIFFFPKSFCFPHEKEQAHHAQDHVTHEWEIVTHLEVVEADLPLGILCMVAGCFAVYSTVFAAGFFLYAKVTPAVICTVVAAVAIVFLVKNWGKLQMK